MSGAAPRFELLVFDWDGTLFDSIAGICRCALLAHTEVFGPRVPAPDARRAAQGIGLGLEATLQQLAPEASAAEHAKMLQAYHAHWARQSDEGQLFPGVPALLAALRGSGYRLALATGRSRSELAPLLRELGLTQAFDASCCADEAAPKPAPAMLQQLMQLLCVRPEATLVIGDTTHDLAMAARAGCAALAVSYGAHDAAALNAAAPLATLASVESLHQWLQAA